MTTPTTFTLANLSDLAGGLAQTASTATFTQSVLSNSIMCTFAGSQTVTLVSSLYSVGNFTFIADAAGFAGRAGSPITIKISGGGTIDGLSQVQITAPNGTRALIYTGGVAFLTIAHNP